MWKSFPPLQRVKPLVNQKIWVEEKGARMLSLHFILNWAFISDLAITNVLISFSVPCKKFNYPLS